MLGVTSELYELMKAITGHNETVDVVLSKLFNNTRLHPKIESIVASKLKPFLNTTSKRLSKSIGAVCKSVWDLEQKYLQNFLFNCTKSALVVPEDLANELGRELQLMNRLDVYVGKEIYTGISLSVMFSGWIQPIVLKQMKLIKQSGTWDWWPKFILSNKRFNVDKSYGGKEIDTPNMGGNIVLLFLLLLSGLSCTFVVFIFEVYKIVINFLQARILGIWQNVCLLWSKV